MGYAVYITRAPHHHDGAQVPIPREDWRAVVDSDPTLEPEGQRVDRVSWAGPASVEDPRIEWANGNLFSLDPDHSVIRKLVDVAGLLGGRVQGADGESYSVEAGRVVVEPPSGPQDSGTQPSEPFRGVGEAPREEVDDSLAEDELAAVLEALSNNDSTGNGDGEPASPVPPDENPNASFARGPDEALEHERCEPVSVPFTVGQRVRTPWGRPGTIVGIDPEADRGMGHIEIQYDDGRTATTSCVSHGLHPM